MRISYLVLGVVLTAAVAAALGDEKAQQTFDPAKAWQQMQQQLTARFDADRDGKLTGQEQLMAQEFMRRQGVNLGMAPGGFPGAEQFNKQFDRDGDGQLNLQERAAAQAALQRMMGKGSGGGVARGVVPGGPQVSPGAGGQKPEKVSPLVKRFDKDGDGKLNNDEKAAAQAELKKGKSKDAKEKDKDKDGKDKAAKDHKVDAKDKPAAAKGK